MGGALESAQSSWPLSGHIPTLDGWRAIAIGGVMVAHVGQSALAEGAVWPHPRLAYFLHMGGTNGVDVFFAISGLLITARLLDEARADGSYSLSLFYLRRAFRILPAAFAYLLVVGLLSAVSLIDVAPMEIATSALFFRNYGSVLTVDTWYTGHFWSLSIEEHFYAFWPLGLRAVGSARRGAWLIASTCLLIGVWRLVNLFVWAPPYLRDVIPGWRSDLRFDALLWGAVATILASNSWGAAMARRLSQPIWWGLVLGMAGLSLSKFALSGLLKPAFIAAMLVGTIVRPHTIVARVLEAAPLRWVGRLSYSLYLWQQLFLVPPHFRPLVPIRGILSLVIALVGLLGCACASHYWLEKPLIAAGRRLNASRK
jgi:peptidoglycan/LPS O-acetylase OafA/YrhL